MMKSGLNLLWAFTTGAIGWDDCFDIALIIPHHPAGLSLVVGHAT
jgi:hypothetical protein